MILNGKYYAISSREVPSIKTKDRILGKVHVKYLMKHSGQITLTKDELVFEGWRTIRLSDIRELDCSYDDFMNRLTLSDGRRPATIKNGEPLRLHVTNDEILYVMVNWTFVTGFNDNKAWLSEIKRIIA
ncbi:hypothetical protein D3C78_1184660 [compost metagenome]